MGCLLLSIIAGILFWYDIISATVFLIVIAGSIVWEFVAAQLYFWLGWFKFYYHDILAWHTPEDESRWWDGCSDHAICKHCCEDILQDSQGNWFTVK